MRAELDWLTRTNELPPTFEHDYFASMLDYAAEDDFLSGQRKGR